MNVRAAPVPERALCRATRQTGTPVTAGAAALAPTQCPGTALPLRGCDSPCFPFTVADQVARVLGSKGRGLAFCRDTPIMTAGSPRLALAKDPSSMVLSGQFPGGFVWVGLQPGSLGRSVPSVPALLVEPVALHPVWACCLGQHGVDGVGSPTLPPRS